MSKRFTLALLAAMAPVLMLPAAQARAQADPMLGQMMNVGFNYCPRGWANADGTLMQIAQFTALFSLLGTTYGGDGRVTFGLPDTRGRAIVGIGSGAGLPTIAAGEKGGTVSMTLQAANLPSHTHHLVGSEEDAGTGDPADGLLAVTGTPSYTAVTSSPANMNAAAIGSTGGGQAVQKRSPYLGGRWCIAIQGTYPSRN